jgi:hypothetical protein
VAGAPVAGLVLGVVNEEDAVRPEDCRRTRLHQLAVEHSLPRTQHGERLLGVSWHVLVVGPPAVDRVGVVGHHGHPVDEVVGGGGVEVVLSPVHPIRPIDLHCHESPVRLGLHNDRAGFGPGVDVRASECLAESWAMFGPGEEVYRSCYAQAGSAIIGGVGHYIPSPVRHFHDPWVLAAALPLVLVELVDRREEHRSRQPVTKVDSIFAPSNSNPRSASKASDL